MREAFIKDQKAAAASIADKRTALQAALDQNKDFFGACVWWTVYLAQFPIFKIVVRTVPIYSYIRVFWIKVLGGWGSMTCMRWKVNAEMGFTQTADLKKFWNLELFFFKSPSKIICTEDIPFWPPCIFRLNDTEGERNCWSWLGPHWSMQYVWLS